MLLLKNEPFYAINEIFLNICGGFPTSYEVNIATVFKKALPQKYDIKLGLATPTQAYLTFHLFIRRVVFSFFRNY